MSENTRVMQWCQHTAARTSSWKHRSEVTQDLERNVAFLQPSLKDGGAKAKREKGQEIKQILLFSVRTLLHGTIYNSVYYQPWF